MDNYEGHRDAEGKFLPGCPGGPGRPRRIVEDKLMTVLHEQSVEAWPEIVQRVIKEAIRGRSWAVKFIASYGMGLPQSRHDITSKGEKLGDSQTFDERVAAIAAALESAGTRGTEEDLGGDVVTPTGETTA